MKREKLDVYSPFQKGKVRYALKEGTSSYGNRLYIEYEDCILMFAHLKEFYVEAGEEVVGGQKIGKIGNSGLGSTTHLHVSAFLLDTKNLNAQNTIDPTFHLQFATFAVTNTIVSNPFGSKYCNPKLGENATHEGIDYSAIHMIEGWQTTPPDPMFQDYKLIEDSPEFFKEN